jgi:hypothetical protein
VPACPIKSRGEPREDDAGMQCSGGACGDNRHDWDRPSAFDKRATAATLIAGAPRLICRLRISLSEPRTCLVALRRPLIASGVRTPLALNLAHKLPPTRANGAQFVAGDAQQSRSTPTAPTTNPTLAVWCELRLAASCNLAGLAQSESGRGWSWQVLGSDDRGLDRWP